jgi:hypothetical protein
LPVMYSGLQSAEHTEWSNHMANCQEFVRTLQSHPQTWNLSPQTILILIHIWFVFQIYFNVQSPTYLPVSLRASLHRWWLVWNALPIYSAKSNAFTLLPAKKQNPTLKWHSLYKHRTTAKKGQTSANKQNHPGVSVLLHSETTNSTTN